MLIQEKEIKLKDGQTGILRSPREEDVEMLLELVRLTAKETDFLLRCPEECNMTTEQELDWIRKAQVSEDQCVIVCEVNGILAGNCEVRFNRRRKTSHRGSIGIALRKEYWGLGIGTAMFEELICIARKREGTLQLELEFVEGNTRALALYEKMGFCVAGYKPNAIRSKDGKLLKEYFMVREL